MKEKKRKNKSKLLIILLFILIIAFTIILLFGTLYKNLEKPINQNDTNNNRNENYIYNDSEDIIKDKVVDKLKFTNIKVYFDGNRSLIDYTITNTDTKVINLGEYEIMVKDKDNNILAIIAPTINYNLKPNESYDTGNSIDIDLSNANSIELNIES